MNNDTIKINYIEFSVNNIEQTKTFYGNVFGWHFTDYGPDYCEFSDNNMTGGFHTQSDVILGGPLIVLYCDDLKTCQNKIINSGGKIVKDIFDFPGGERFHFTDINGYELAVWRKVN